MRATVLVLLLVMVSTAGFAAAPRQIEGVSGELSKRIFELFERFQKKDPAESSAFINAIKDITGEKSFKSAPPAVQEMLVLKEVFKMEDMLRDSKMRSRRQASDVARNMVAIEGLMRELPKSTEFKSRAPKFQQEMTPGAMDKAITERAKTFTNAENSTEALLKARREVTEEYALAYATGVAPSLIHEYRGTKIPESMTAVRALMEHRSSIYYSQIEGRTMGGLDSIVTPVPEKGPLGAAR